MILTFKFRACTCWASGLPLLCIIQLLFLQILYNQKKLWIPQKLIFTHESNFWFHFAYEVTEAKWWKTQFSSRKLNDKQLLYLCYRPILKLSVPISLIYTGGSRFGISLTSNEVEKKHFEIWRSLHLSYLTRWEIAKSNFQVKIAMCLWKPTSSFFNVGWWFRFSSFHLRRVAFSRWPHLTLKHLEESWLWVGMPASHTLLDPLCQSSLEIHCFL